MKIYFSFFFSFLRYKDEINSIGKQYPVEPFQFLDPPLKLDFAKGVSMLREAGVEIGDNDDLSTPDEKFLGKLVKAKVYFICNNPYNLFYP